MLDNSFTVELICNSDPIKSINDLHTGGLILGSVIGRTAWDKSFINVNGKAIRSEKLNIKFYVRISRIPGSILPIVCAARSCPPLRSEAYEGFSLNDQLNDQGRIFLVKRADLNSFDGDKRIANLSSIFSWFLKDFGRNSKELLEDLLRRFTRKVFPGISRQILQHGK